MHRYYNKLIEVINRLHAVVATAPGLGCELEIPQIIVIGSQSSGKSSILEHIAGFEFLPRGTDIVTRCPIVLQLHNTLPSTETFGEFGHLPEVRFEDFKAIKNEIIARTRRLAGDSKGISKVYTTYLCLGANLFENIIASSPQFDACRSPRHNKGSLALLLIQIPVGSQPKDVEAVVREIILSYARKPSTLMLAIIPANMDIVNSEALKFVTEIDPAGQRTLGILSKLDLMDAGTNALELLMNRGPVRLLQGFVGVVCRSQKAIIDGTSIQQSLESENAFFSAHPIYSKYASSIRCGTRALILTLSNILLRQIRVHLPTIKSQLTTLMLSAQSELKNIESLSVLPSAHDLSSSQTGKGCLVLKLLTKFSSDFENAIQGTSRFISTSELIGGARLQLIFHDTFAQAIKAFEPTTTLSLADIRTAIRNATGARPSLFVPEISFELLAKQQIANLEAPSLYCVSMVYDELLKLITTCASSELARYPNLHRKVTEVASALVKERLEPTKAMVQSLIAIELAYINTNHPDFCKAGAALAALEQSLSEGMSYHDPITPSAVTPSTTTTTPSLQQASANASPATNHSTGGSILNFFFRGITHHNNSELYSGGGGMVSERAISPLVTNPTLLAMAPEPAQANLEKTYPFTEKDEMETHLILTLIRSYFNVVRKNISDSVPKATMHFLVNSVKENLHNRLVTELYRSDSEALFEVLLQEDPVIVKERERIVKLITTLSQSADVLAEVDELAAESQL